MAIHTVLKEPNPLLHRVSLPVTDFDAALQTLCDEMLETMYAHEGIGLAAPQIGILKRLLVIDLGESLSEDALEKQAGSGVLCIANPEIIWVSAKDRSFPEGCLSIPGHYVDVARPEEIRVRYQDPKGTLCELWAKDLLAVCLQHEIDHLDGITLLDHEAAQKKHKALRNLPQPSQLKV